MVDFSVANSSIMSEYGNEFGMLRSISIFEMIRSDELIIFVISARRNLY